MPRGPIKQPPQNYCPRIYAWQLSKIRKDDDTDEQLFFMFQNYYQANLQWLQTGQKRAAQDARYWLTEFYKVAKLRRKFILEWLQTIKYSQDEDKSYKAINKRREKVKKRMEKLHGKTGIQDDETE